MAKRMNTVTEREIRRRRSSLMLKCLIAVLIFLSIVLIAWIIYDTQFKKHDNPWTSAGGEAKAENPSAAEGGDASVSAEGEDSSDGQDSGAGEASSGEEQGAVETRANRMAAQYDYDGAIALLKDQPDYDRNERFKSLVASYEESRYFSCV